ncbi:thiamine pyrophosphate-binding protein [Enterovibrio sp. Hal110]
MVDVVNLMKPITKYSEQVVDGNNVPAMVRECFRLCSEERPGAGYLELPEDIADEDSAATIFDTVHHRRPDANMQSLEQAADMIKNAKMPLLPDWCRCKPETFKSSAQRFHR